MTGEASGSGRVLLKLRSPGALGLADPRANLRPLFTQRSGQGFDLGDRPAWYVADLGQDVANAWDLAHQQVAGRLGIDSNDVLFAEPDQVHTVFPDPAQSRPASLAAAGSCAWDPQDASNGRALGQGFAWHLDDAHSQLAAAGSFEFTEPRTRIAHLDTGYYPAQETCPEHLAHHLERSFVDGDREPGSAADPDNKVFLLDNSGHGTGTIAILAGNTVSKEGRPLGGAPQAEIVPLRVADRVVLLRTSALAQAIDYAARVGCQVATLSMGGLPSRTWAEAVDGAYDSGLLICAAAGNNVGPSPPRTVVYPARYDRVLAVCGVMADGRPYDLQGLALEGSFGPPSAMDRALAAYTPNIPWAKYGCVDGIGLDGQGTSAATPQVAAAAALWIEKFKARLPADWRRIEAVRHALFTSAKKANPERFGNGILRAKDALAIGPRIPQTDGEKAPRAITQNSFAFLRLITGIGLDAPTSQEEMLSLELTQRWLLNPALQDLVPDLERAASLSDKESRDVLDAIIADDGASLTLRRHAAQRYPVVTGGPVKPSARNAGVVPRPGRAALPATAPTAPRYRRLRVYAVDPSLAGRLDSVDVSEATLQVPWEQLARPEASAAADDDHRGAVGEYFAIADVDPGDNDYGLVDLDDPRLIAGDGWAPSEGNPHFHQQMVYAVARKTVDVFERALGRPVLWQPINQGRAPRFRQRLTLRPHALQEANAYYSPEEVSLRFGYFDASAGDPDSQWPGTRVYTCLSADIVAHETSHAILDGMYRRFREPTNPDVLALHEGFADIVALLQHFTIPSLVEQQIAKTRGQLDEVESLLGSLASQVGLAAGRGGPLRDAIGKTIDGRWQRSKPNPKPYETTTEPHARGSILVAAVFDAFLAVFNARTADLVRLATGGTGLLPGGAIHPDLVRRLAAEATKSADHVLNMIIRGLDYLPPVDVTFFDCLRALITADVDLVSEDLFDYRVAFVEAFRRWGIHPDDAAPGQPVTLGVDTLRWTGLDQAALAEAGGEQLVELFGQICAGLRRYADAAIYHSRDRGGLFKITTEHRRKLKREVVKALGSDGESGLEAHLGLARDPGAPLEFEIEELRRVTRVRPDGGLSPQVVVTLTQERTVPAGPGGAFQFRGGTTMIVDLRRNEIIYSIGKGVGNAARQARATAFVEHALADPLRAVFFGPGRKEPFAALHSLIG